MNGTKTNDQILTKGNKMETYELNIENQKTQSKRKMTLHLCHWHKLDTLASSPYFLRDGSGSYFADLKPLGGELYSFSVNGIYGMINRDKRTCESLTANEFLKAS